ncbi:MAG: hypothetical protein ACPGZU_12600 [Ketobacter sp.]
MDLLRLPLIALVGFVAYGETVDFYLAVGAGLILLGNALNLLWDRQKTMDMRIEAQQDDSSAKQ